MKKYLLLFFLSVSLFSYADPDEIVLNNQDPGNDRSIISLCVFYDNDTHEIIVDGGGEVSFYDVEITSAITGYYELSTIVNGTYDTFDVSSLPIGTHVITIISPLGDVYEGHFTIN